MEEMAICIDIARCTACRACQVACKNWNQLKAEKTENRGTHENPPDLSANTWNRISMAETRKKDGGLNWSFFNDRCRHCSPPPCEEGAEDVPGAVTVDETGAVVYSEKTAQVKFEDFLSYCPYNIPRQDPVTHRIFKCNMCIDRIKNGLKPACVTACLTGTLNFGTKEEMVALANKRVEQLGGDANLYPGEDYHTMWVLPETSENYPLAKIDQTHRRYQLARRPMSPLFAGAVLAAGLVNLISDRRQKVAEAEAGERD